MTLQEEINQIFTEYENGHITMGNRNAKIITLVINTSNKAEEKLWETAKIRYGGDD